MSEVTSTPSEVVKAEVAKQAVILLFAIATMVFVMAITQPDFLRTLRMRVAAVSNQLLSLLARKAGRTSMGIELQTGRQRYRIPYRLSQMRDDMRARYEREAGQLCQSVGQLMLSTSSS